MQSKPLPPKQLPKWLDRLGDWNPQLLRELKGRMNDRLLVTTFIFSLIGQIIFLIFWLSQISKYEVCVTGKGCSINWTGFFIPIFSSLNWLIPYIVYLPGISFLIADLTKENRQGTANFLRLSPRSSQNIILGKLLGVPSPVYLALFLLLPLHVIAGVKAQAPLLFFLSYYSILVVTGAFLFTLASLIAGFGQSSRDAKNVTAIPITPSLVFLVGAVFIPFLWNFGIGTFWSFSTASMTGWEGPRSPANIVWFWQSISNNLILAHTLIVGHLMILTTLFWQFLQRAFQNPNVTFLTKRQSYFLVPYLTLFILGFSMYDPLTNESRLEITAAIMAIGSSMSMGVLLPIAISLSTSRQTTLDWIKTRSVHSWRDRIWGIRSPGATAIAINLVMMVGILIVPVIFNTKSESIAPENIILMLIIDANLIMIYGLLYQTMLLVNNPKRQNWANIALFNAIGFPLLVSTIFTFGNISGGRLFQLMSPLSAPFAIYDWSTNPIGGSFSEIWIALFLQFGTVGLLYVRLRSQLKELERS